jgi:hypothetical protein
MVMIKKIDFLKYFKSKFKIMCTYFISGHLDLTWDEFEKHYKEQIDTAINKENSKFIVGDAKGADLLSQKYLASLGINKVTIYHMHDKPRNIIDAYIGNTIGEFKSDEERDSAMTRDSDYDILWIRPPEEQKKKYGKKYDPNRVTGTEKNKLRRSNKELEIMKASSALKDLTPLQPEIDQDLPEPIRVSWRLECYTCKNLTHECTCTRKVFLETPPDRLYPLSKIYQMDHYEKMMEAKYVNKEGELFFYVCCPTTAKYNLIEKLQKKYAYKEIKNDHTKIFFQHELHIDFGIFKWHVLEAAKKLNIKIFKIGIKLEIYNEVDEDFESLDEDQES